MIERKSTSEDAWLVDLAELESVRGTACEGAVSCVLSAALYAQVVQSSAPNSVAPVLTTRASEYGVLPAHA